ncbi:sel1 repeat family protein [Dyella halodurans]|uniref:Tetratricopeptide repeat protein n=1 Tax=Dyella halodurans TaxID=1920171 RepID=A0ABV9C558_9GAMM|nr:sel1 repeat family protein [Dyella halodurans]
MTAQRFTKSASIFLPVLLCLALAPAQANSSDASLPTIPIDAQTPPPKVVSFHATPDVPTSRTDAFNTPQDDGRPGEYFFYLGALANQRHDYSHAIAMYEISASWAYKPAQYNLGVLYLNGHGSEVDLPRAMAWFALAAERGETQYVYAKQLLYAHLTPAQFEQANEIWRELLPRFGDATALARAKARWREVLMSATGSRVGSAAPHMLTGGMVGLAGHQQPANYDVGNGGIIATTPGEVTGVHNTDGAIAYEQLRASRNPYDPKFETDLLSGTVTVGILTPITKQDFETPYKDGRKPSSDTQNPDHQ